MYTEIGEVPWTEDELRASLHEFAEIYHERPIKNNYGGMDSAHGFYTWWLARKLQPKYIIESGVWYGQSTWLLEQGCPSAQVISLDPVDNRQYISEKAVYFKHDFKRIVWDRVDKDNTLVFFDDHYGVDRVFQAKHIGFTHILYEDNYHDCRGNTNNPSGSSCSPKAVLSRDTVEGKALRAILETYYEFPPIYPNNTNTRSWEWAGVSQEEFGLLSKRPLVESVVADDVNEAPTDVCYINDAPSYTWIAYLKLKQ